MLEVIRVWKGQCGVHEVIYGGRPVKKKSATGLPGTWMDEARSPACRYGWRLNSSVNEYGSVALLPTRNIASQIT